MARKGYTENRRPGTGHRVRAPQGGSADTRPGNVSLRCLDCKRLQFTTEKLVARAARVKCHFCGGRVERTDAYEKRIRREEAARAKAKGGGVMRPYPCTSCPKSFRGLVGLKMHVVETHERPLAEFEHLPGTQRPKTRKRKPRA